MEKVHLLKLETLKNTVNGNPRYKLYYIDNQGNFTHAITQSDGGFCYGINNGHPEGKEVMLTFSRAGRVTDLKIA
jgi:hypothetical protein